MSAWAEKIWLKKKKEPEHYSVFQSTLYFLWNIYFFKLHNLFIFYSFSTSIFINNLTRKATAAELPAEILLGSKGSVTEEHVLIFSVSPSSF